MEAYMVGRTQRVCQVCGKTFYGNDDHFYCLDCARARKSNAVVRIRICQDCKVEFLGGPRAKKCPDCAYAAKLETSKRHKNAGTRRPLGSIDKCPICGNKYTVVSGRQKYCSAACQRKGVLEWQRVHKQGYDKISGQSLKKQKRRKQVQKICIYCLRPFSSHTSTNLCSDYCRSKHKQLSQCIADINRGRTRDLKKYEDERDRYRERYQDDR